jgi:HAE1 family hydrophobic/amphiphilic exporter-1
LVFLLGSWRRARGPAPGPELRQPLGIAVVGGLCVSQLLTLFITPVIYIYLDRIDRRLKRRLEPQFEEVAEAERPHVVAAE